MPLLVQVSRLVPCRQVSALPLAFAGADDGKSHSNNPSSGSRSFASTRSLNPTWFATNLVLPLNGTAHGRKLADRRDLGIAAPLVKSYFDQIATVVAMVVATF